MLQPFSGFDLVEMISRATTPTAAHDVAAKFGLSAAAAQRRLESLVEVGVLQRTEDGAFDLAASLTDPVDNCSLEADVETCASSVLEALAAKCRADTYLAVADGRAIVVVDHVSRKFGMGATLSIGDTVPAHSSAGRILLSTERDAAPLRETSGATGEPRRRAGRSVQTAERRAATRHRERGSIRAGGGRAMFGPAAAVLDGSGAVIAAIATIVPETAEVDPRADESVREAGVALTRVISDLCPGQWWKTRVLSAANVRRGPDRPVPTRLFSVS